MVTFKHNIDNVAVCDMNFLLWSHIVSQSLMQLYVPTHVQLLETQRHESQRSLIESRHTAEQLISEMEQQLTDLKNQLAMERATISSLKEENLRSTKQFQAENFQLRESLAKVLTNHVLPC